MTQIVFPCCQILALFSRSSWGTTWKAAVVAVLSEMVGALSVPHLAGLLLNLLFDFFFFSSSILRSPFHSASGNIGQVLMAQSFFLFKGDFSVMQMTIKTQLPLLNLALTTGKTVSLFLQRYNLLLENKTLSKHYRKKRCTLFSLAWEMGFMPLSWLWIKKGLCKWKNNLLREKYSFLHLRLLEKNPCVQNCWCMHFWTDTMCQLHGTHGNTFFNIQKL